MNSRNEQARQFYNAAGTLSTDFSFMNYGFAPLSAQLSKVSSAQTRRSLTSRNGALR